MGLTHRPATVKEALRWCKSVHRRLPKLQGARWAVAVERDGAMVGFALVGSPARLLDDGVTLAVTRVAVLEGDESETNGHKGACSILYAACARAARDMGALDLLTYIHADEPGKSLRGAGWIKDVEHVSRGGEHSRPSRPRAAALDPLPKVRWLAPWSRLAQKYLPLATPPSSTPPGERGT